MKLRRLYIDTHHEHVVYLRRDSPVCLSEGFQTQRRVLIECGVHKLMATLNLIGNDTLADGEAGLSESAWVDLQSEEGQEVKLTHPPPLESMKFVRSKIHGNVLDQAGFSGILLDIVNGRYSAIEIAAFVTACSGDRLTLEEIGALTRAMVAQGQKLSWAQKIVTDKHCIGGLPGNRTSPIVVAIIAEAGLVMPKTSSRAITSPAGTADTMATMTPVNLNPEMIKRIVAENNGCLAWGGSMNLSPADDVLIRIERVLDIDSEGQMIASVLSKKSAAGSTHVLIDIPVGRTAKVRTFEKAEKLKYYFNVVGASLGMKIKVIITDGEQPVGNGIGPALEAMDVLDVLRQRPGAPPDLRQRALMIAGEMLEFAGSVATGKGLEAAAGILTSGRALSRFMTICKAQGGFSEPLAAPVKKEIVAHQDGTLEEVDNRKLAQLAKLAGAPEEAGAGIKLDVKLGDKVRKGDRMLTLYTRGEGEQRYAMDYFYSHPDIFTLRQ